MSLGNTIVISQARAEHMLEGTLTASALYPGTCLEMAPVALTSGRQVLRADSHGTSSGGLVRAPIVAREDENQGGTVTKQYAASSRVFAYVPSPGEEINVIVKQQSGTSPSVTVGEIFMVDTSGFLDVYSSGVMAPFMCMEAFVGGNANTLTWCIRT